MPKAKTNPFSEIIGPSPNSLASVLDLLEVKKPEQCIYLRLAVEHEASVEAPRKSEDYRDRPAWDPIPLRCAS